MVSPTPNTDSPERRYCQVPLCLHTRVVTTPEVVRLAKILLPPSAYALYEHIACSPTGLAIAELAHRSETPVGATKITVQSLLSSGLAHTRDEDRSVTVAGANLKREQTLISTVCPDPVEMRVQMPFRGERAVTITSHFGRARLSNGTAPISLTGSPRHWRHQGQWDEATRGTLGMVILVEPDDPRATDAALAYCRKHRLPYVLAVPLQGAIHHARRRIRRELELNETPILGCDPHDSRDVTEVLWTLLHLVRAADRS
ncbi:hypothetical protein [Salinactinospora qingdaonensis]|uniref:Uncharacterized protein n=1 Tax=Salinactinospora qingdaonensis TaxID=702744 RepID=A0ABP7FSY3_9ACTN